MNPQPAPKQPPHSIEAEQSVLGGLLLRNDAFADVAALISETDFYRTEHQTLFRAIGEMLNARRRCDFVTVQEHLRNAGKLEEVGGVAYLGSLVADTYGVAGIAAYAEIVRERSVLRQLIALGAEISDAGYRPEGRNAAALLEEAERKVFAIRSAARREGGEMRSYAEYVTQAERGIELQHAKGGGLGGISTGFLELDQKTDGLHPGDLVVIAGHPGTGKTTLAMNIVEHAAMAGQHPSAVFSMEMSGHQVALRSIAAASKVHLSKLRGGNLGEAEYERIGSVGGFLRTDLIRLDETGALSPMDIRARARRAAMRAPLKIVVVDYIQLMQVPGSRENRTNQVSEITRSLKALAKELGVTVIALSQLSRESAKEGRRPRLSDLRDSGGIGQDADLVLFVHRETVVDDAEIPAGAPVSEAGGLCEVVIGKQRQGPCGVVRLSYTGKFCRFDNPSDDDLQRAREFKPPKSTGFRRLASVDS